MIQYLTWLEKHSFKTMGEYSFQSCLRPLIKTLIDMNRLLLQKLTEKGSANVAETGISEVNTEADEILDDLIMENDVMEEQKRRDVNTWQEGQEKILGIEKSIRELAVSRLRSLKDAVDIDGGSEIGTPDQYESDVTTSSHRKMIPIMGEDTFDEDMMS